MTLCPRRAFFETILVVFSYGYSRRVTCFWVRYNRRLISSICSSDSMFGRKMVARLQDSPSPKAISAQGLKPSMVLSALRSPRRPYWRANLRLRRP